MSDARPAAQPGSLDPLSLGAILVTVLFWASAFAGIRAGLAHFSPGHLTLYRFLVASLALGVYALAARIPLPGGRDLVSIFGLSLLGITLYHAFLNFGELAVPAGTASLIIAAGPVLTALLASALGHERLSALGWGASALSFAGVALIVLGRTGGSGAGSSGLGYTAGALLILGAALCTSLYFVLQRPLLARLHPFHFTVWSLILGSLPFLVFLPGFGSELARAPLSAHLAVIYIGLFPAALAYLTWTFALSRVPASRVTSFLYVSPVLAIFIAWLWLGEVPSVLSLLGGAVALVGVVLLNTLGRVRRG